MADIDFRGLRNALGAFPTGVTVVTTLKEDGAPHGFTANSFTSVSLDPPLVLVCLAKSASSCPAFAAAAGYAVNILSEDQRAISAQFASKSADKFAAVAWQPGPAGNPILAGTAAWLDCFMHEVVEGGDHLMLLGRVVGFDHAPVNPLGYCRGAYVTFGLERDAVAAQGRKTIVGAILEHDGRVLLLEDPRTGLLTLPAGAGIGNAADRESLLGGLKALGIEGDLGFLFAVFEDAATKEFFVYYRGTVSSEKVTAPMARFIAFEDIPWQRLASDTVRSMLRRYVNERLEDRFGIYVGDAFSGRIHPLERLL